MFDHTRSSVILLSAILMFAAVPAIAGTAQTQSVTIRSSDLDLATDAGQAIFQQRIGRAVERVCGVHPRTTWELEAYTNCRQTARAGAASQFDALVAAARNSRKVATDGNNAAPIR
jgi:UrcA family protein